MPMSLKSIIFALVVIGILLIAYGTNKVVRHMQKTEFQKSLKEPKKRKRDGSDTDE